MNSEPLLSPELWERTPPEAQAYIRALEARVAALEVTVQQLREQLQQDSRTSSRPRRAIHHQPEHNGRAATLAAVGQGDNPATKGRHGCCCPSRK